MERKNRGTFDDVYNTYDHICKRDICHSVLDSELKWIEYMGITYPTRTTSFWNMTVRIATKSLNDALYDDATGLPTSKDAVAIDDTLFYFVQDDEIYLPEQELLQLLDNQVV